MKCVDAILLAIIICLGIYVSDEEAPIKECQNIDSY